jgi:pantoate--beta-alanine ligase
VRVVETVGAFSGALEEARRASRTVGLVPTMGALHDGHRSLVDRATAECDVVAVTIFVNPLQFSEPEDLARYPRSPEADLRTCRDAGCDLVFAPSVAEMYPDWPGPTATSVHVARLGDEWEGAVRPGHFDGVATVVAKLFAMAGPCRAYFGEKDFQQLALVRRMVVDLSFPVEVVGCPTVRGPDGLALSSRNARLTSDQRAAAPVLWRALSAGRRMVEAGESSVRAVESAMAAVVAAEPRAALDYVAVVDADHLTVATGLDDERPVRLLVAARFGAVRLIDNSPARPAGPTGRRPEALTGSSRA